MVYVVLVLVLLLVLVLEAFEPLSIEHEIEYDDEDEPNLDLNQFLLGGRSLMASGGAYIRVFSIWCSVFSGITS